MHEPYIRQQSEDCCFPRAFFEYNDQQALMDQNDVTVSLTEKRSTDVIMSPSMVQLTERSDYWPVDTTPN